MSFSSQVLQKLTIALFVVSFAIGLIFTGLVTWANVEASLFDSVLRADGYLNSLSCPWVITTFDTGTASATVTNTADRRIRTTVRGHITDGYISLMSETDTLVELEPGQSQTLSWDFNAGNTVWNRFVLLRVYMDRRYPLPSATASCGVLFFHIPWLTGRQLTWLVTGVALAGMIAGILLWTRGLSLEIHQRQEGARLMLLFAAILAFTWLAYGLGSWLIGALLFLLLLVMSVVVSLFLLMRA